MGVTMSVSGNWGITSRVDGGKRSMSASPPRCQLRRRYSSTVFLFGVGQPPVLEGPLRHTETGICHNFVFSACGEVLCPPYLRTRHVARYRGKIAPFLPGYIGSGRQNWDGSGGTGAALRHYEETGRK